jgi:importin-7
MPPYFVNPEVLQMWMVIIKTVLDSGVPPELENKVTDEEEMRKREKSCYWRNKKWCGRILQRFIQKYGNPKWETSQEKYESKGLSDLFQTNYSVPFLESFLAILFKSKSNFVGLKLIYFSLKYIFYSIRIETSFRVLQQYFDRILFDLLVPLLSLTPRDEELWNTDPEEYVRKEEDFSHIGSNNKNVAMDLIESICCKTDINGESYLIKFVNYSAACMTMNCDPRTNQPCTVVLKESLLWAFGVLKEKIMDNETLAAHIETILEKHVGIILLII